MVGEFSSLAMENVEQIQCNRKNLVSQRTLISRNKKVALCGCGNTVVVFGLKTGKILRKLESHDSAVTDFYFRKKNPFQVISASEDGCIIIWDYTDGTIIKRSSLSYPICTMLLHPKYDDIIFVTKKRSIGKDIETSTLLKVDLNVFKKNSKNVLIGESICSVGNVSKSISISKEGDYVASIKGRKLKLLSLSDKKLTRYGYEGQFFTCVAFHPTKLMIATGNCQGKIVLWQNFTASKTPITTELHWHAHAVDDLLFTNDGLYLLSGGIEAVMVTWQLETLEKDFTPRLGAPIKHLSVSEDDTLAVVSLTNNVVKVISTIDKKLCCSLRGISKGSSEIGMRYDPRTDCLVLPGSPPGHLQFYNADQDSVSVILDVVGQNYLSGIESKSAFLTEIQHFDLSYDGMWLATIEKGTFKLIPDEVKLKFWHFDAEDHRFKQNTVADPPHEENIVDLHFRPKPEVSIFEHLAVTSDEGGKFKIWALETGNNKGDGEQSTWSCHAVCYYGNGPCGKTSFSEDGSLLAVTYGKTITVWDAEIGEMKTSLNCPVQNEMICDIVFGCGPATAYLLVRTSHYLICWNLLTCTVWWSLEAQVTCMATDPFSGLFAVFASFSKSKSKIYFFEASSPKPVAIAPKTCCDEKALSAVFTGTNDDSRMKLERGVDFGNLYFFTDQKNIYKALPDKFQEETIQSKELTEETVQSEFEKIFGFRTSTTMEPDAIRNKPYSSSSMPSSQVVRKILATPSHVLPSVTTLCSAFFKSMSIASQDERYEEEEEDKDKLEESDNDDDSSGENVRTDIEEQSYAVKSEKEFSIASSSVGVDTSFGWLSSFIKGNYKK